MMRRARWAIALSAGVVSLFLGMGPALGGEVAAGPGAANAKPSADELHREATRAFERADIEASAAAFDRLVEHYPERIPHLWQRGITLYYAGRYEDCVEQFVRHREVNPHDAENSAWHFLCTAKLEGMNEAAARLFPARDPRVPLMAIHALYASTGTLDDVFAVVSEGDPSPRALRVRDFYANLYIALWYEAQGEGDIALEYLDRARFGEPVGHYMETVAEVHRTLAIRAREMSRQDDERRERSWLNPRLMVRNVRALYGTPMLLVGGLLVSCLALVPLARRRWAERWLSVALPLGEIWPLLAWGVWSSVTMIQAVDHMRDPAPTAAEYWSMAFSQALALGVFAAAAMLFSLVRRAFFPRGQSVPLISQALLLSVIWIDWMLFLLSITTWSPLRRGYIW